MTSCQVSENLKIGPPMAQRTITNVAPRNISGFPAMWATHLAKRAKAEAP
jgi:hypothetical protein